MKAKTFIVLAALALILVIIPTGEAIFKWIGIDSVAHGEVIDFKVNLDSGTGNQVYSNITSDADGNFIVTWYDNRYGNYDVFAQRFDYLGDRLGNNFKINDDGTGHDQYYPRVCMDGMGKFVVVWQDYRDSGYPTNPDIYGQRYNDEGTADGGNFLINDDGAFVTQRAEDIDCDDYGNYVVVFSDYRDLSYNIYCRRYDHLGHALGASFLVNDDCCSNPHHNPRVAVDADGDFVIVWYDKRSNDYNIYMKLYDADGNPRDSDQMVNEVSSARQVYPDVSCDAYGNFVVAWTDYRNGVYPDDPDIYGQRFLADGTKDGDNFKVNDDTDEASQIEPAVAMDFFGNSVITWTDDRNGDSDIYAQYYNQNGVETGENYKVNSDDGTYRQSASHITMDGISIYYTWTDERSGNFDIYARVTDYGSPGILINPAGLSFEGYYGQEIEETRSVSIDNTGYGILNYDVEAQQSWITVSTTEGTAPDTIQIGVDATSLDCGYHYGSVEFSDSDGGDSSRTCAVTVLVDCASIYLSEDTLRFTSYLGDEGPLESTFELGNSGFGDLDWSAVSETDWIDIDTHSGTVPPDAEIGVTVDNTLLSEGTHLGFVTISAPDAINSPESLVVEVTVLGDRPYIVLSPDTLELIGVRDQAETPSDDLTVMNLSDEICNWSSSADEDWVNLTPSTGIDSVDIEVEADVTGLATGEYYADIEVSDPNASNTPQKATVHLTVLPAPAWIETSVDTLEITHIYGNEIEETSFEISNAGDVSMPWMASDSDSMFHLEPSTGVDDETVIVYPRIDTLELGEYYSEIVVESDSADNSPCTLFVKIDITENPPMIALSLDTLVLGLRNPGDTLVYREITIENGGGQTLEWSADPSQNWLSIDPDSGTDADTLTVEIDFGQLVYGSNIGEIVFSDGSGEKSSQVLYVEAIVAPSDTLYFESGEAEIGEDFTQDVNYSSFIDLSELYVPISVSSQDVTLESLAVDPARVYEPVSRSLETDSSSGNEFVRLMASDEGRIKRGDGRLLTLYYSSDPLALEGPFIVDTFWSESCFASAVDIYDDTSTYESNPGVIYLGPTTAADEIRQVESTSEFALYQNRPNPFNSGTMISFSIPQSGEVVVELYNILGQRISELYHGFLSAGTFEIQVESDLSDLASGIYFYRLRFGNQSQVKKMVMLR